MCVRVCARVCTRAVVSVGALVFVVGDVLVVSASDVFVRAFRHGLGYTLVRSLHSLAVGLLAVSGRRFMFVVLLFVARCYSSLTGRLYQYLPVTRQSVPGSSRRRRPSVGRTWPPIVVRGRAVNKRHGRQRENNQ